MSNYTLNYFGVSGRGELIRLLFAAAGIPFTDKRIETNSWPTQKPLTPLG